MFTDKIQLSYKSHIILKVPFFLLLSNNKVFSKPKCHLFSIACVFLPVLSSQLSNILWKWYDFWITAETTEFLHESFVLPAKLLSLSDSLWTANEFIRLPVAIAHYSVNLVLSESTLSLYLFNISFTPICSINTNIEFLDLVSFFIKYFTSLFSFSCLCFSRYIRIRL